ncbi:hypothetical protein FKP32DRAFT_1560422 [Trametes sanguinea]|nr:hypothetical protein FKP32DRAFT_1560422 [Trametes sanguinea]
MSCIPRNKRPGGIERLPFDVLLQIFDNIPAEDLVHLLCTCRALYSLAGDETVWRSLSSRYGLHDNTHFDGRTWYIIYTRLLHTYGPMLGLWAGDHPYTGNVIEILLDSGNSDTPGGIVVDMWCFRSLDPEEFGGPEMPEPPVYRRLARIDFAETSTRYGPPTMCCHCDSRVGTHRGLLTLLSPTVQGFYLLTRQGRYPHPDFPSADSHAWVNDAQYPRLTCLPSPHVDQGRGVRPHPRVPTVYAAHTSYLKPHAVSLTCDLGCMDRARPFLGFENISPSLPRFYPLRRATHPWVDPDSPEWDPRVLEGLWLGSHGPHGTEVLYMERMERPALLRAWKITGDENVPRGALSWQANVEAQARLSQSERAVCAQCLGDLGAFKLFSGTGTFSGRGFMPHQLHIPSIVLAVGSEPLLRVVWVEAEEVSAYMRHAART